MVTCKINVKFHLNYNGVKCICISSYVVVQLNPSTHLSVQNLIIIKKHCIVLLGYFYSLPLNQYAIIVYV